MGTRELILQRAEKAENVSLSCETAFAPRGAEDFLCGQRAEDPGSDLGKELGNDKQVGLIVVLQSWKDKMGT